MERSIPEWLPEEETSEVRLRTLKECEKLPEDDAGSLSAKKLLPQIKAYERGLKKLQSEKPWAKYDAIYVYEQKASGGPAAGSRPSCLPSVQNRFSIQILPACQAACFLRICLPISTTITQAAIFTRMAIQLPSMPKASS